MKNVIKFFLIFVLAACSRIAEGSSAVGATEYSLERKCWFDENGDFSSFLIVKKVNIKEFTVSPFSAFCYVEEFGSEDTTANYLDSLKIDRDGGFLSRFIGAGRNFVSGSEVVDKASTSSFQDYDVYYFKGDLSLSNIKGHSNKTIYNINKVYELKNLNLKYSKFVKLDHEDRLKIFKEYISK